MSWIKLTENRERVREALLDGYVDEVVACRATAFDQLAGAMNAFGYWEHLEEIEVELEKDEDDVPNELLLRELATMPLLRIPNPYQVPTYLFQDHGVLRFLGFTLKQIRDGFNDKGVRSPSGEPRMRPHHRDTLYNALKAINIESLNDFRREHRRELVKHNLLTSGVFAIDGTGLCNSDKHVVILQQAGEASPFIASWRVQGPGKELSAGRAMVDELLEDLGPAGINWLLLDGAYVDGAWLADLQRQGVGAMVRVYERMNIFQEMRSLTHFSEYQFEPHRYVRTIQGHKEVHEVELALVDAMDLWESYWERWEEKSEQPEEECPGLWGLLIREERENEEGEFEEVEWGLVITEPVTSREEGFELWRNRWDVENQGFRELNQGGWLESQNWGRSESAILTSIALKVGAHNCYCLMQTDLGEKLAVTGLRDLQHHLFGTPPQVMIVVEDEYTMMTAEELVTLLGVEVETLLDPSLAEAPT
jgi:hypothetical protein